MITHFKPVVLFQLFIRGGGGSFDQPIQQKKLLNSHEI